MQTVTPFSFIDYFLQRISEGKLLPRSTICRCIELILSTVKGIEFLEFRPSEIALAVAISVSGESQTVDLDKAISYSMHVEKERVLKCFELI
ncbi:cyclin-D4-2-like [Magnolia sinica]|uniref:cyclin-D4-2-like n=1 Tax=Magnolia sinica TaxID=86752 RepID=UPI002658FB42|nr:cyclin-D4-2-like [Magnolia sinica]